MKIEDRRHVLASPDDARKEIAMILSIGSDTSPIPIGIQSQKIAWCFGRSLLLDICLKRPVPAAERARLIRRLEYWAQQELLSRNDARKRRRKK